MKREFLPGFIVVSLVAIFGGVIVVLMVKPMPMTEAAGTLLTALIGMLSTKISTIVDYYFGSNKSSKEKDATILAQAQAVAPEPIPPGATIHVPPAAP